MDIDGISEKMYNRSLGLGGRGKVANMQLCQNDHLKAEKLNFENNCHT